MGALPNVKPRSTDQYGRDPQSPSEQLRRRTNYSRGDGWSKLFHAMVSDIPRLSRGASCTHLILAISAHQDAKDSGGWTPSLSLDDWASLAACDAKEVQRNRDYLKTRKMADCKVDTKRLYSFRLKPEGWQALEDHADWYLKQPKVKTKEEREAEEAAAAGEDAAHKAGNWRMSKPAKVAKGKVSKPFKPDCGIASFRFSNPNAVDIDFFAVVKAGELLITPTFKEVAGVQKAKSGSNKAVKAVAEDMGVLGKRGNPTPTAGRRTASAQRKLGEDHPRAAELCAIFDPLLQQSGSRLLSPDQTCLMQACEALGPVDHDYLLHFVMGPGGRGERPISGPRAVLGIVKECRMNWDKGARGKPSDGLPTKADIDAMVAKEREELAKKRAALRRKA